MTSLSDLPLRNNLRGLTPYGAPQLHVPIQLNVNENTHPIPEDVATSIMQAVAAELRGLNRYPDREFTTLREELSNYLGHNLTKENIWAGNGSNEIIQHIFQTFGGPGRKGLTFSPSYSMYALIASGTDTEWITVPRDEHYLVDSERAVQAVTEHKPDILIFCSPNNPTGSAQNLDTIAAAYDKTEGIVVVDEAYAEFQDKGQESALTLLPGRERLIVLRTMSKAFAFAGARVGYLAADEAVCQALRLVRLPYHLSSITQAAAVAAVQNAPQMLNTVDDIRAQRQRIERELTAMGFSVIPSQTNFVLFGGVKDSAVAFNDLLEQGIIIRDLGIPGYLRVTAGTESETTAFLTAIKPHVSNTDHQR